MTASRPGRSTSLQPTGWRSTGSSTSRPAVRPIMSAPGPRLGQLGKVGQLAVEELAHLRQRVAHGGAGPGADAGSESHCASLGRARGVPRTRSASGEQ